MRRNSRAFTATVDVYLPGLQASLFSGNKGDMFIFLRIGMGEIITKKNGADDKDVQQEKKQAVTP